MLFSRLGGLFGEWAMRWVSMLYFSLIMGCQCQLVFSWYKTFIINSFTQQLHFEHPVYARRCSKCWHELAIAIYLQSNSSYFQRKLYQFAEGLAVDNRKLP